MLGTKRNSVSLWKGEWEDIRTQTVDDLSKVLEKGESNYRGIVQTYINMFLIFSKSFFALTIISFKILPKLAEYFQIGNNFYHSLPIIIIAKQKITTKLLLPSVPFLVSVSLVMYQETKQNLMQRWEHITQITKPRAKGRYAGGTGVALNCPGIIYKLPLFSGLFSG